MFKDILKGWLILESEGEDDGLWEYIGEEVFLEWVMDILVDIRGGNRECVE